MERPDQHQRRNRNGHRPPTRVQLAGGVGRTEEDIHVCPECDSELVQPIEWAPVDMRRWRVALRCPECNWETSGVFSQHVLDRYDAILDEGANALLEDLEALERSNMEDEIASFVVALDTNVVLPEDF